MAHEICPLCLDQKELCESHAIPDSFFAKIFRKNNGKGIVIVDDNASPISYSSDSWSEKLLCFECEQHISNTYEGKAIQILRGKLCTVVRGERSVALSNIEKSFGTSMLKVFFCSILWRSALSSHGNYSKVKLTNQLAEILRKSILNRTDIKEKDFSVRLLRIIDSTQGGFAHNDLKEVITSPFFRKHPQTRQFSFCYILEGFFVEIFIPGLKHKSLCSPGVIRNKQNDLFIPFLEVFEIPEFLEMAVSGYRKSVEGLSNVKEN
jgi:hypothetical protein